MATCIDYERRKNDDSAMPSAHTNPRQRRAAKIKTGLRANRISPETYTPFGVSEADGVQILAYISCPRILLTEPSFCR